LYNRGFEKYVVYLNIEAPENWRAYFYSGELVVTAVPVDASRAKSLELVVEVPVDVSGSHILNITLSYAGFAYREQIRVDVWGESAPAVAKSRWFIVTPGTSMPIVFAVKNPYSRTVSVDLSLKAPEGWTVDVVDPSTKLPVRGLRLEAYESADLVLTLSVPEDAAEGVYVVSVVISGDLSYVLNYTITVVKGHSVKVWSPEQAVVSSGPYAKFKVYLKNTGTKTEVVDLTVESPLPCRILEGQTEVKKIVLLPGEERVLELLVEVPPVEGNYTVVFKAGKQELTFIVYARSLGGLVYLNKDWCLRLEKNSEGVFEVRVSSRGRTLYNVRLQVDAPPQLQVEVEPETVAVLKPGEEAVFRLKVRGFDTGVYYVAVRAVAGNSMAEEKVLRVVVEEPFYVKLAPWLLAAAVAAAAAVLILRKKKLLAAFFLIALLLLELLAPFGLSVKPRVLTVGDLRKLAARAASGSLPVDRLLSAIKRKPARIRGKIVYVDGVSVAASEGRVTVTVKYWYWSREPRTVRGYAVVEKVEETWYETKTVKYWEVYRLVKEVDVRIEKKIVARKVLVPVVCFEVEYRKIHVFWGTIVIPVIVVKVTYEWRTVYEVVEKEVYVEKTKRQFYKRIYSEAEADRYKRRRNYVVVEKTATKKIEKSRVYESRVVSYFEAWWEASGLARRLNSRVSPKYVWRSGRYCRVTEFYVVKPCTFTKFVKVRVEKTLVFSFAVALAERGFIVLKNPSDQPAVFRVDVEEIFADYRRMGVDGGSYVVKLGPKETRRLPVVFLGARGYAKVEVYAGKISAGELWVEAQCFKFYFSGVEKRLGSVDWNVFFQELLKSLVFNAAVIGATVAILAIIPEPAVSKV
ncbi:MAG: hypothetical protein DRJ52_11380, partial [Thermoprotei archaeon]